jgi:hypothetical protein
LTVASRFLSHVTLSADSRAVGSTFDNCRSFETAIDTLDQIIGPSKSIHLLAFKLSHAEITEIAQALRNRDVLLEVSPLFEVGQGPKRGGSFDIEQWRNDRAMLNRELIPSSALMSLDSVELCNRQCSRARVYVSASGVMRWCAYEKEFGVSLLGPRSEIRRFLVESTVRSTPLAGLCAAVCR